MFKEILKKIPGFRTGTKWKMVLASIMYLIMLIIIFYPTGLTMRDKIISSIESILFFGVVLILVANVGDIRSKLPLFKKKKIGYNILGGILVALLLSLGISFLENFNSPEQKLADSLSLEQIDDKKVAEEIDDRILELGRIDDLTLKNAKAIKSIRKDYDALTTEQKEFVTNINKLELAEKKIEELNSIKKAEGIDKRIIDLGDVNALAFDKLDEIKAIRKSYDGLTKEQQKLVTKLDSLVEAESKIPELQLAADKAAAEEAEAERLSKEEAAKVKAAEEYQEWIERQFSFWDGSNRHLVKLVKENLHDPKSFEHVETVYWDNGDHLIVKMTYRANNAFGGLILQNVTAKSDYATQTITIISQND